MDETAARGITGSQAAHNSRDRANVVLIPAEHLLRGDRAMSSVGRGDFFLALSAPIGRKEFGNFLGRCRSQDSFAGQRERVFRVS